MAGISIKTNIMNIGFKEIIVACAALVFCSCSADEVPLAQPYVFMSGTTVSAGNVSEKFFVPSEGEPNYRIDWENRKLEVILGVSHDGIDIHEGMTIKVEADKKDTERSCIDVVDGAVLPDDTWSLPAEVQLEAGSDRQDFVLGVDLDRLEKNYKTLASSNLVLSIRICGSSLLPISPSRSSATVIIDGSLFIPSDAPVEVGIRQAVSGYESDVPTEYPVPFAGSPGAHAFDAVTGTLDIFLNLDRNGVIPLEGYEVDIQSDPSHTASSVPLVTRGAAMPEECIVLPGHVAVENGQLDLPFVLRIDVKKLIEEYPELSKNRLVATVALSGLSKYGLKKGMERIVVVVNAPNFYPRDPDANLVKGGDFSEGSQQYWLFNAEQGHNYDGKVEIRNGQMVWSVTNARCLVSVYQKITFEVPGAYNMLATFHNPDGTKNSNARCHITLTKLEPIPGVQFDYSLHPIYIMSDVWGGENAGLFFSRTGQFMAEQADIKGVDTDGLFMMSEDDMGDWYIVIGGYSYNSGSLNVAFDDIFIGEAL